MKYKNLLCLDFRNSFKPNSKAGHARTFFCKNWKFPRKLPVSEKTSSFRENFKLPWKLQVSAKTPKFPRKLPSFRENLQLLRKHQISAKTQVSEDLMTPYLKLWTFSCRMEAWVRPVRGEPGGDSVSEAARLACRARVCARASVFSSILLTPLKIYLTTQFL